ncbi:TIP41-like [Crotalus adamanteus]|uniref:TIP41-like protein n=1 Tax=Crotalus adamanteus TaxID=8729 RepID=A0AAW1BJ99_CROAD
MKGIADGDQEPEDELLKPFHFIRRHENPEAEVEYLTAVLLLLLLLLREEEKLEVVCLQGSYLGVYSCHRRRKLSRLYACCLGVDAAIMMPVFKSSRRDFAFGPWKLTAARTHIIKSADAERLAEELHMPCVPEMMFGDNILRIQHELFFGIEFNATDALKCVNNSQGMVKVACAEEWQESRSEPEHTKEVVKPYDWTYTTDYKGTLLEHIDTEKLKAREQIMFFEEVLLFEDELHDHGVSSLSVKIRVMPSSFFVLLRFFLRVDGVLIRMNDTRIYHEANKSYMLREYTSRESKISNLKHIPPTLFTDPNEIAQYLPVKENICEKLEFPENSCPESAAAPEGT